MILYRAPRGTADILPQDQLYWRHIESNIYAVCKLYGYQRIDTPVFEDADLFVRGVGKETDIVQKETYTFEDRSGDMLTLRPEGTASVCRAYLEHGMPSLSQPVKLFYIAQIFRHERPQAGRFRQHWQFGFECIGSSDPVLDAEVIDMTCTLYRSIGLEDLVLKLNSIGCQKCRPDYINELKKYYADKMDPLCADCQRRLEGNTLRLLDCKRSSCMPLTAQAPKSTDHLCDDCSRHFSALKDYLNTLGLDYILEHRLVRGLDYYTKTVFEIQPPGEDGAQSTIGGGGRYDDLIEEIGGKSIPAVGFATGFERMILNLRKQDAVIPALPVPSVFVACIGEDGRKMALGYVAELRRAGVAVIQATGNRSLKAQMRQANVLWASHALIVGGDEMKDGKLVWRDMLKSDQSMVSFAEVFPQLVQGV